MKFAVRSPLTGDGGIGEGYRFEDLGVRSPFLVSISPIDTRYTLTVLRKAFSGDFLRRRHHDFTGVERHNPVAVGVKKGMGFVPLIATKL